MTTLYNDYQDEPEDIFITLPEELSSQFYHLEMKDFSADIEFYKKLLPPSGNILEMGCGTGRVTSQLADRNRLLTGIDISLPMLQIAQQSCVPHCSYICMDMTSPAFSTTFDSIIIPYNTLNLLTQPDSINRCLQNCHHLLHSGGTLIVQIFVPSEKILSTPKKTFQFQLFDRPEGGKIIKEILKEYSPETETMDIEERFRIRPMQEKKDNEDYHSKYTILAWPAARWLSLFAKVNFTPVNSFASYAFVPYMESQSTCFLIILEKK